MESQSGDVVYWPRIESNTSRVGILEPFLCSNPLTETVLNEVCRDKKTLPEVTLRKCNMWCTSLGMMGAKRLSHRDASKATRLSVCPTSE
jgi:hypothetical protein